MTRPGSTTGSSFARRYGIAGALALAVLAGIVYVSFTANSGLPLSSTYELTVDVPNADRLAAHNDVRIGGVRVGQVAQVTAMPAKGAGRPFARLELSLESDAGPLPADTTAKVRPASLLGQTYVDLEPGRSRRTVANGGRLALRRATSTVELTDLLDVFDKATARGTQKALMELGHGVAGRGVAVNRALDSLVPLLPQLTRVSRTLAARDTRLAGFLRAYESFVGALDPVSGELAGLVSGGATTFGAVARERRALAATIEAAPPAERSLTGALTVLQPSLDGLATLSEELRPPVGRLPGALRLANSTLTAGVRPLRRLPRFSRRLRGTLATLDTVSRDPATGGSLRKVRDLLTAIGVTLDVLVPAQVQCNVTGLWAQNFGSGFGGLGFGEGPGIANVGITHLGADTGGEWLQNGRLSSNVAINNLPNENFDECESGNEPYDGKQILGNPPGLQSTEVLKTRPPAQATAGARAAGLLDEPGTAP